ncbi:unnamed protein product [Peniophora sp. CBMAI 1063]|nr:unnamed protein product [Peniophora sp. CBMAI 1063]
MQQFDQFDQFLADQGVSSSSDIRQMDADLQPFAFDYGMPLTSDGTPTSMTAISQLSFWDHFWVPGESWPVDDPLSTGGQQQRDPQSGMPNRPSGTIVPDKDASLGYDRSPPLPFDPSTSLAFVPGKGAIRSDYDLAMQRHDDLLYVSHDTLHASGAGEQALKDRPTSPDIQATIHVPGKPSTVVSSRQYPILKQLYGPP